MAEGKVLIAGTGRAGTTFLMQLLTALKLDTGYTADQIDNVDPVSHAGLESGVFRLADEHEPGMWATNPQRIIKSPQSSELLDFIASREDVCLDHVYIPIRHFDDALNSRLRVGDGPGGLFDGCTNESELRDKLLSLFYRLVEGLVRHDIAHTFLYFPRLAMDAQYSFRKLQYVLDGTSYEDFLREFNRLSDQRKINFGV